MTGDNFSNHFLRTSDGISEACKDWVLLIMRNLKGSTDFLEEGHLAAPLPSSQVSTSSAKSHLSYYDSPRSQPLALAPEATCKQLTGAVSAPPSPAPLYNSHWNNIFVHRKPPAAPSSPRQAITLTPPPPNSPQHLFNVAVHPLDDAVLQLVSSRQPIQSKTS